MTISVSLPDQIRALLSQGPTAVAGKLQMIGISEIRERLGDRWERSRDQIAMTVERAISHEMTVGDIYFKIDELAYVILFSNRDVDESRLVCAKIAQNVCRKLFGEDEDVVRVRSLTCEADGSILAHDVSIEETLNALLEKDGKEEVFSRDGQTSEMPESQAQAEEQSINIFDSSGAPVEARLSDLEFQFSPIWDISKRVVVTYLCRGRVGHANQRPKPAAERFILTEDRDRQVDIDVRILADCAHKLRDLRAQNRRVLVVCPTHWSTLARPRAWEQFKLAFHALPDEVAQDLIICAHGLDTGLPNIRITQEFPKLNNRSRAIYACVGHGDKAVERFTNTRTAAVGFVVPDGAGDERAITSVARDFCIAADAKNLPAFAFGVSTRSVAMALIGIGYRYLEGTAIRLPTSTPRDAFSHETIDLFRSELEAH
jgi:hypothetical protein